MKTKVGHSHLRLALFLNVFFLQRAVKGKVRAPLRDPRNDLDPDRRQSHVPDRRLAPDPDRIPARDRGPPPSHRRDRKASRSLAVGPFRGQDHDLNPDLDRVHRHRPARDRSRVPVSRTASNFTMQFLILCYGIYVRINKIELYLNMRLMILFLICILPVFSKEFSNAFAFKRPLMRMKPSV